MGTLPASDAIAALVARLDMDRTMPMDYLAWRFDIVLRGRNRSLFEGDAP